MNNRFYQLIIIGCMVLFSSPSWSRTQRKCLKIEGMSCGSCREKIQGVLLKTEAIVSAEVSLKKGLLETTFKDESIQLGKIQKIIQDIGYKSSETACD